MRNAAAGRRLTATTRALSQAQAGIAETMKALVKDGDVLEIRSVPVPKVEGGDVLVKMHAAALNPTDLARMGLHGETQGKMAAVDGSGQIKGGFYGGKGQQGVFGGEGSGIVVAAGPDADQSLVGKRVAAWSLATQGSYAEYYKVPGSWTVEIPDSVSFEQAAAPAINPLTALAMVDIAKTEGHRCMIHTAAASQLGQMLIRLCELEGLELINIVRKPEQVELLRELGAENVLNISDGSFRKEFSAVAKAAKATIAFDAVGGETTRALMLGMPTGSRVLVYGSLGGGDVTVPKAGQLLAAVPGTTLEGFNYGGWMAAIGSARRYAAQQQAAAMLGDTLATTFGRSLQLEELVTAESVEYFSKIGTNNKVVIVFE